MVLNDPALNDAEVHLLAAYYVALALENPHCVTIVVWAYVKTS
jgi:hypothetical protein